LVSGAVTFGCEVTLLLPKIKPDLGPGTVVESLYSAMKDNFLTDMALVCEGNKFPCHKVSFIGITDKCIIALELLIQICDKTYCFCCNIM
jgi:hypothetical protein